MRLAAAHAVPCEDSPAALALAVRLAREAAAAGATLLVLPERFAAGRVEDRAEALAAVAEPSDGPVAHAMQAIARATGVALLYGYVERCTGQRHDSLMLIDGAGCCLANYRRTHVKTREAGLVARGQWLSAMPLGPRRLGLLAGHDLAFPEVARGLRLVGCDLLLVAGGVRMPAATAALLTARAVENGCAVALASADQAQPAAILDPAGHLLAASSGATPLALADLPPAEADLPPDLPTLAERRPQLYRRLTVETGEA